MIFSNLAGTTNNQFKVNGDGTGQILSNNAYDLFWACPDPITGAKNPNVRLLPNNADLDEYRLFPHMGQWYSTMETTATIENLPDGVTAEFTLLILTNSGNWDGYLRQEIVTNDGVKFERRFNGFQTPSWSAWKQVAYISDFPIKKGTFTLTSLDTEAYTVRMLGKNVYLKIDNYCIMNVDFYVTMIDGSKLNNLLQITGLPYHYNGPGGALFGMLIPYGQFSESRALTFFAQSSSGTYASPGFNIATSEYDSSQKRMVVNLFTSSLIPRNGEVRFRGTIIMNISTE